jgi:hypothetical protein
LFYNKHITIEFIVKEALMEKRKANITDGAEAGAYLSPVDGNGNQS